MGVPGGGIMTRVWLAAQRGGAGGPWRGAGSFAPPGRVTGEAVGPGLAEVRVTLALVQPSLPSACLSSSADGAKHWGFPLPCAQAGLGGLCPRSPQTPLSCGCAGPVPWPLHFFLLPFECSCLYLNPMGGGAWWAAVHGVAKSWARLSEFPFTFHFHTLEKEMATHSSVLAK